MRVGVGSGNPIKRQAVESVLHAAEDDFGTDATVESVPVNSGVSEQPRSHRETITGAETRAKNVLSEGYDLGVGIEGGIATMADLDATCLVMWAVVDDGTTRGHGSGPTMVLPPEIARRVQDGEELGPVMDDILDQDDVARKQGAAGAFTNGRVGREDALATAVAGALGPFVTGLY